MHRLHDGSVKSRGRVWRRGAIAARRAFYETLPGAFAIPSVKVEIDERAQNAIAELLAAGCGA